MGIVTTSSEEMGNANPYANKKWVACSDNNMYVTINRCGHLYAKNTVQ